MRRIYVSMLIAFFLLTAGCAELTTLALKDKFVKPATVTRTFTINSVDKAVKASVTAAGKTGWTPKTISVETGYLLAEYQPQVVGRSDRDYAYKLEVRIPDKGTVDIQVTVTPPQGIMGGKAPEASANEFLDALTDALKK